MTWKQSFNDLEYLAKHSKFPEQPAYRKIAALSTNGARPSDWKDHQSGLKEITILYHRHAFLS